MRKRTSKRRWKARCHIGRAVPRMAIENYDLTRWFVFAAISLHSEMYKAVGQKATLEQLLDGG